MAFVPSALAISVAGVLPAWWIGPGPRVKKLLLPEAVRYVAVRRTLPPRVRVTMPVQVPEEKVTELGVGVSKLEDNATVPVKPPTTLLKASRAEIVTLNGEPADWLAMLLKVNADTLLADTETF